MLQSALVSPENANVKANLLGSSQHDLIYIALTGPN